MIGAREKGEGRKGRDGVESKGEMVRIGKGKIGEEGKGKEKKNRKGKEAVSAIKSCEGISFQPLPISTLMCNMSSSSCEIPCAEMKSHDVT